MDAGYRLGAVVYHPEGRADLAGVRGVVLRPGLRPRPAVLRALQRPGRRPPRRQARGRLEHEPRPRADARADRGRRAGDRDDTDRGWHSRIVALARSGIASLADLRGRRVGFGDADSPHAQILPVHALRAQGWEPERDFVATRLDRDLGKHGDTGGAELAQLARVRAGELDTYAVSSVTYDAIERTGDASGLVTFWRSLPFHGCCFTVTTDDPRDERFAGQLFSMDAADPKLCEPN